MDLPPPQVFDRKSSPATDDDSTNFSSSAPRERPDSLISNNNNRNLMWGGIGTHEVTFRYGLLRFRFLKLQLEALELSLFDRSIHV